MSLKTTKFQIFHQYKEFKNSIHDNKAASKLSCARDKEREFRSTAADLLTIITHLILLTIFHHYFIIYFNFI